MIGETLRKRHAEETYAALKEKEYRQKKRQDLVNKYRRYVLEGVVDYKSKDSQGELT